MWFHGEKFESQLPVKILTKDNDYLQLVTDNTTLWLMHSSAEKTQEIFDKYHMKKKIWQSRIVCFRLIHSW